MKKMYELSSKAIDLKDRVEAMISYHCNQIMEQIEELEEEYDKI